MMTPRERAEQTVDQWVDEWGLMFVNEELDSLIAAITTAIQAASNEQLERQRSSPINALVDLCHGRAKAAGWWDNRDANDPNTCGACIALIHSEVSEALEGMRKGLMDDHLPHRKMEEVELADSVIRICDYAGARGFDLAGAIMEKLEYNRTRADHKREARAAAGGKKI